jgi:TPR repeat protein
LDFLDGKTPDAVFRQALSQAREGNVTAQYITGFLYAAGIGVVRNDAKVQKVGIAYFE